MNCRRAIRFEAVRRDLAVKHGWPQFESKSPPSVALAILGGFIGFLLGLALWIGFLIWLLG